LTTTGAAHILCLAVRPALHRSRRD